MEPGHKLDTCIALYVMGWNRLTHKDLNRRVWIQNGNDTKWVDDIPKYSTDISAAWEVVERIKSIRPVLNDFGLHIDHPQEFNICWDDGMWKCCWRPYNLDGVTSLETEAETAPHAICLAALKAMDIEINEK